MILTADRHGSLKGFCNFRVKLYIHISGVSHLCMSGIDSFDHPICEGLAYNAVDDIGYVLARHLNQLLLDFWQSISYLCVALRELEKAFD